MMSNAELITTQNVILQPLHIVLDDRARQWCKLPYPNHPYGCPNYDKSEICPPKVGLFNDIWDMEHFFYAVVVHFDMKTYISNMKVKHPEWTMRQLRNPLYWQNSVRKVLNNECKRMIKHKTGMDYTLIPEAQGMHVFSTMRNVGIIIKQDPVDEIIKVGIVGNRIR